MKPFDPSLRNERYLSTYTGKHLHLLAPDAAQIDIQDIAHGLAHQCCFNGQTHHFYSVAQHSLMVANLVPPRHRLAALLHDAVAAYFGGMNKAMQQLLPDFALIEKKIMVAVSEKFNISGFDAQPIKRAHHVAQATELRDLQPISSEHAQASVYSVPIPRRIEPLLPDEAKRQFLALFAGLDSKPSGRQAAIPSCQFIEQDQSPDPLRLFDQIRLKQGEGVPLKTANQCRHGLQAAWERARH